MSESILKQFTKKDIDYTTRKILNIVKSGQKPPFLEELDDGAEREKNKKFRLEYGIEEWEGVKKLLLENLTSKDIADIQLDERPERLRNGQNMYIYLISPNLSKDGIKFEKVDVYVKMELLQIKGNKKVVLLISLHEPNDPMYRNYNKLA